LHAIERDFGRDRTVEGARNAPRVLDLDLIAHGRAVLDEPGIVLPHPRAAERLFVVGPLAEIAPAWRHPVSGETAAALAAKASVGADARLL
jgi:2-amino-4-hydroxy-6-hydroxymethyldihydropteridine diphosphokinase